MGMTHRRRVSGVSVNGNVNGNGLNVETQSNGVNALGVKRRDSTQNRMQVGIQFLQRAAEGDLDDNDPSPPLLNDLDSDEGQGDTNQRMRAEAKSIRKVNTPSSWGCFWS